jgi:hypothetical protein
MSAAVSVETNAEGAVILTGRVLLPISGARLPLGKGTPGRICFEAVREGFLSRAEGEISPIEAKILSSSAAVMGIWTSMRGEVAY